VKSLAALAGSAVTLAIVAAAPQMAPRLPADLLLVNGHVYTLTWDDPDGEGRPAANAPQTSGSWRPDAQAIAVRGGRLVLVGTTMQALTLKGPRTRVVDVAGATVIPGLVDSHVHVAELGASLERVNLVGVRTEAEAVGDGTKERGPISTRT
jgi:predicted amidohydrolase YtcJ